MAIPRGVVKLSSGGMSSSSRRELRREKTRENHRGKKKERMMEEMTKYANVPSRVFPRILLFPKLLPTRDAPASERAKETIEATATSFEKRRMIRDDEARKYMWAPRDFLSFSLASFSNPKSHPLFILRISRSREIRREMKMSLKSVILPKKS